MLFNTIKIIENGDQALVARGKPPIFKQRAIERIETSIDKKFDEKLKDAKDIIEILEKIKFTVADLIDVFDHVVKSFPKSYNIFGVFEERYKRNIEKRILPFLDDEQKISES